MFRWTPDGKSFGKGPVWGIAQTGQNVVLFYNKKKLRQAGFNPIADELRGVRQDARDAAREAAGDDPVIEEGNKEGYGFIHLFGGIWGANVKPQPSATGSTTCRARATTLRETKALAKLQNGRKAGYFNDDYNAVGNDASAAVREGQGRVLDRRRLGLDDHQDRPRRGRRVGPSRPARAASSRSAALRPVAHLGEDEVPRPRRGVAQLRDHLARGQVADVRAQQLPADKRAKPPAGDPYLTRSQGVQARRDHDGLLLYTDWASPSMYTTLQNQFQLLLAGRSPRRRRKAVQDDWAKFDKTLR